MADLYNDFEELRTALGYGTDYHLLIGARKSPILFTAIHGGGIESGCTELAMFSAKRQNASYYCFEGWKASGNTDLHITSTHFDEPNGRRMVADSEVTISYHGYSDTTNKNTKVGGGDLVLRQKILDALKQAGFNAELVSDSDPIAGVNDENIVNSNKRGMGVQLEISTAQRNAYFGTNTRSERRNTTNAEFDKYVKAVLSTLN